MNLPTKSIVRVAIVTALILLIPFFGNIFVDGWVWDWFDFVWAGAMIFCFGLVIDAAARKLPGLFWKVFAVFSIVVLFMAIWAGMVGNVWEDPVMKLLGFFGIR